MELVSKFLLMIFGLVVMLSGHHFFSNSPKEKVIDEIIENVIEEETGFDITDLTNDLESVEDEIK